MKPRALLPLLWLVALCAVGCSEKPPAQVMIWDVARDAPVGLKAAITGVVWRSHDEAIAVGFSKLEAYEFTSLVALRRAGAGWEAATLPAPLRFGSAAFLAVTVDEEGTVWACGHLEVTPNEFESLHPLVYRYDGTTWSEMPTEADLGERRGVDLNSIAVTGRGATKQVRVVGTLTTEARGVAFEFADGHWSEIALPAPASGGVNWGLAAVRHGPDGRWYAAGPCADGLGGAAFVDDGSGWRALPPAPGGTVQFTSIAFDGRGTAWFTANRLVGDSLIGGIYEYRGGGFLEHRIARRSTGAFRIFAIDFDREGHGWAVGGRRPDDPFFAGWTGSAWNETLADPDAGRAPVPGVESGGGELFGVSVRAEDGAIAVGQAEEFGVEGVEFLPRFFYIIPRPVGEKDGMTRPLEP